ncbi:fasciclin domain-containing protein [Phormidium sp. LEGE 05292]|uniref:fasciclin domain-containing protein n=1 Tax=[Phormidium] sp. LEGE 05292 TaxID=767427 RepID=UPI001882A232|nr:fasciclin domain-containing protein [Phormidium sp. LEGE 05292]MBE9226743.1 fasciclin domain-containing protein [Phormidium sp. LEGE 05292]
MKAVNSQNWIKKLSGVVAVAGVSAFISLPVLVQAQSTPESSPGSMTSEPAAAPASEGTSTAQGQTIVALASTNDNFSTLKAALEAAGLTETLAGQGPFTVFAPTNAAFEALGKEKVQALLKPENKDKLIKVLTYHVVPGQVLSTELKSGKTKTVEGAEVTVMVKDGKVKVNNAQVTQADVKASNGVIHVIDKVLLPPDLKL